MPTDSGGPPSAETRHRLWLPARLEEKRIDLPSADQARLMIYRLSLVTRRASPVPSAFLIKMSSTPLLKPRIKATVFPSGENVGLLSPTVPGGGVVSWILCPVSSSIRTIRNGSSAVFLSDAARY